MTFTNYGEYQSSYDECSGACNALQTLGICICVRLKPSHSRPPPYRYVLLKERNLLHSEKLAYKARGQQMPDSVRLTKVRKSMGRMKQVMSERLREHEDPQVRMQLKAFIDAM